MVMEKRLSTIAIWHQALAGKRISAVENTTIVHYTCLQARKTKHWALTIPMVHPPCELRTSYIDLKESLTLIDNDSLYLMGFVIGV